MNKPTVWITQGLPASGKTTAARVLKEEYGAHIVCLDDIREMLSGVKGSRNVHANWSTDLENTAIRVMLDSVKALVRNGKSVVVANCHMTRRLPNALKVAVHEAGGGLFSVINFLDVPVEECIRRDAERGVNSVGETVIRRLAKSNKGWRLTDDYMNDMPEIVPAEYHPDLPWCVISDLDGTLALHQEGSNPYDDDRILKDTLNRSVADQLDRAARDDDTIILLTARDGNDHCRGLTEQWLEANYVQYDHLIMRQEGDKRNDSVVKLELFNEHIRGKYNVRVVWDDRERVVATWRQLGLPTHQVAYGDF